MVPPLPSSSYLSYPPLACTKRTLVNLQVMMVRMAEVARFSRFPPTSSFLSRSQRQSAQFVLPVSCGCYIDNLYVHIKISRKKFGDL